MPERVHPKIQRKTDRQQLRETIVTLGLQNVPSHEIATKAGCHKSTVKKILDEHEIPVTNRPLKEQVKPTPKQVEKFLSLYFGTPEKGGISLYSAASLSGITQTAAKRYMEENEIEGKGRGGHGKKTDTV